MKPSPFLSLLAVVIACSGCDCSDAPERAPDQSTSAQSPAAPPPAQLSLRPAKARGTLQSDDTTLHWAHEFDANRIVDAAACGGWFYTATHAGRLVRYDLKKLALEDVSGDFHSVTAVNTLKGEMIVGTEFGRLSRADCRLTNPEDVPERLFPIRYAQIDPRSRNEQRAFVIYERIPGHPTDPAHDPATERHLVAAHVDLKTGRSIGERFDVQRPQDSWPLGFVDYRGQFWMGLSSERGTNSVWHLQRFEDPSPVAGLEESPRLNGFAQVGREVWAYLGSASSESGYVVRIDTRRARTLWDGEKFKTGQHAGGDVPKHEPVTLVTTQRKGLLVLTPYAMYTTDREMRRWKRLGPAASEPRFRYVRGWTRRGDGLLLATRDGLVLVERGRWREQRVPTPSRPDRKNQLDRLADWAGRIYVGSDDGLRVPAPIQHAPAARQIESGVLAMAVDSDDRLWVLTRRQLHLLQKSEGSVAATSWPLESMGLVAGDVTSLRAATERGVRVRTTDGSTWSFSLSKPGHQPR